MSSFFNQVPGTQVNQAWYQQVFLALTGLTQSGPTSERPTKTLWEGRAYFDTTLGKPIWYKSPVWIDATGSTV